MNYNILSVVIVLALTYHHLKSGDCSYLYLVILCLL